MFKDKNLKLLLLVLYIVLALLVYILVDILFDPQPNKEEPAKPVSKFKSTTPEGKLREISDYAFDKQ
jgi:hypothetical protein